MQNQKLCLSAGKSKIQNRQGFTLVELIIVIAIIAILAGAIFVAVDPARRLHETRNARRHSDVQTVINAIRKHQVDNNGDYYTEIASATNGTYYVIGTDDSGCSASCTAVLADDDCVDLTSFPDNYLSQVPQDPRNGSEGDTGYYFVKSATGGLTVGACNPEGEGSGGGGTPPTISVSR